MSSLAWSLDWKKKTQVAMECPLGPLPVQEEMPKLGPNPGCVDTWCYSLAIAQSVGILPK